MGTWHIPPSGVGRAVSSGPAASPGHPAEGEEGILPGHARPAAASTGFLWGPQALIHSPRSSCPDPRTPTSHTPPPRALIMGFDFPDPLPLYPALQLPGLLPQWPQRTWLPGQSQLALAGPRRGQSPSTESNSPWHVLPTSWAVLVPSCLFMERPQRGLHNSFAFN